jgi:hypothetical protein
MLQLYKGSLRVNYCLSDLKSWKHWAKAWKSEFSSHSGPLVSFGHESTKDSSTRDFSTTIEMIIYTNWYIRIPAAVATLRDCFFPSIGISTWKSDISKIAFWTHSISFPTTIQISASFGRRWLRKSTLLSSCSSEIILTHSFWSRLSISSGFW